ncbi:hypothetical protein OWV82_002970 [Melia azedarach]|uniref:Uncharacterized protein n=1 Tax=Melia azedarach TaxID=155640 RepID=A0ACC1Z5B6_MELAZ|nr:hypothetical protein OWV82_002970 [Melia azedarach]
MVIDALRREEETKKRCSEPGCYGSRRDFQLPAVQLRSSCGKIFGLTDMPFPLILKKNSIALKPECRILSQICKRLKVRRYMKLTSLLCFSLAAQGTQCNVTNSSTTDSTYKIVDISLCTFVL